MKRFRFSLLSLVSGVMLAGGLGYLNVRPPPLHWESIPGPEPKRLIDSPSLPWDAVVRSYGWPLVVHKECVRYYGWDRDIDLVWRSSDRKHYWHWPALAANIAIGLAIVFVGAGACEYVVRRRGKKSET